MLAIMKTSLLVNSSANFRGHSKNSEFQMAETVNNDNNVQQ